MEDSKNDEHKSILDTMKGHEASPKKSAPAPQSSPGSNQKEKAAATPLVPASQKKSSVTPTAPATQSLKSVSPSIQQKADASLQKEVSSILGEETTKPKEQRAGEQKKTAQERQEEKPIVPLPPFRQTKRQAVLPKQEQTAPVAPKEETGEKTDRPATWIPASRTYKSDVEAAVKGGQTQTSIALAEQRQREKFGLPSAPKPKRRFSRKNIILIAASAALVAAGIGIGIWAFLAYEKPTPPPSVERARGLIFAEQEKAIRLTEISQNTVQNALRAAHAQIELPFNHIMTLFFIERPPEPLLDGGRKAAQGRLVPIQAVIARVSRAVPDSFLRSLGDKAAFGIHSFDRTYPFLIFSISSFSNAFSGILEWEEDIARDLAPFLGSNGNRQRTLRAFEDVVIKNHDARMLRDENNTIILLYSFIDRETLVITTNEVTFDEVVKRLQTPGRVTQ